MQSDWLERKWRTGTATAYFSDVIPGPTWWASSSDRRTRVRAEKRYVPGPTACSTCVIPGPTWWVSSLDRRARGRVEERDVPGPTAYILHALFQGPLGERAVRTDGQGGERKNGMFQAPLPIFYMRYSRAHLVSEQFGPTDKGESGGAVCSRAHCLYSTCVIPGPTWWASSSDRRTRVRAVGRSVSASGRTCSATVSAHSTSLSGRTSWCLLSLSLNHRGSQRDVIYLGWPIAPTYMSPNAGGGGLQGLSQWVQLYTGAQINLEIWLHI